MPRPPRRSSRRNYDRIDGSGSGRDDDDDDAPSSSSSSAAAAAAEVVVVVVAPAPDSDAPDAPSPPVSGGGEEGTVGGGLGVAVDVDPRPSSSSSPSSLLPPPSPSDSPSPADVVVPSGGIIVVLMDAAQSKFNVRCHPSWRVSEFKEVSARITKVPPRSQRLIHMGKLLSDGATLDECGIREDGRIVHLFPKPNVVIGGVGGGGMGGGGAANEVGGGDDGGAGTAGGGGGGGGAHVPQIIIDEEEASRRSQILILSSQEIFEAQHRVKVFSFLLMIISSMELLTLMTLFVGVQVGEDPTGGGAGGGGYGGGSSHELPPGNPTDSPPSPSDADSDPGMEMRTWQDSDYFDALVSAFGFYVSLLGIKATTENTLQLAKRYLLCLSVAGVGSNCYYYYLNVSAQRRQAEARDQRVGGSALYTSAFVGILLPLTVWMLCIVRAYQFQSLIREAEVEAEERTRGSYRGGGGEGVSVVGGETPARTISYGSEDLELAVERGVST